MADLRTDYMDDILSAAMGGERKYEITFPDGTTQVVKIKDVTEYEQIGSTFGAGDINKTNQEVNLKFDSDDVVDPMLSTEEGFAADALKTKQGFDELYSKIDNIKKNTVEFLQGEATISQVYPGSTNSLLVQFEHPFSDIPVVLCSLLYIGEQSGPHVGNIESVSDITKSGFIVNIKNTGMTYARNYTFNWTANVDTVNT